MKGEGLLDNLIKLMDEIQNLMLEKEGILDY